MNARGANERGQVALFVLGLALVAFAVSGVAVDGTRAFLMRRSLQNAADAAALAGASELHTAAFYSSGGRNVVVDLAAARRVAASWLARRGLAARPEIHAAASGVSVVLRADVRTTFLGLVGIDSVRVAAGATAEPIAGAASTAASAIAENPE